MFANSQMGGMALGIPDVNLTPPVAEPIPYPNFALGPIGFPATYNILLGGTPGHNLATIVPLTLGDQPGILLGVISHEDMGQSERLTGSFTFVIDALPTQRVTSFGLHNGINAPGVSLVPSQLTVLDLMP